jgi:hypothetical protein
MKTITKCLVILMAFTGLIAARDADASTIYVKCGWQQPLAEQRFLANRFYKPARCARRRCTGGSDLGGPGDLCSYEDLRA